LLFKTLYIKPLRHCKIFSVYLDKWRGGAGMGGVLCQTSLVQHQKVNVSPPIPALDSAPRDKERGKLLRTVDC